MNRVIGYLSELSNIVSEHENRIKSIEEFISKITCSKANLLLFEQISHYSVAKKNYVYIGY